MRARYHFSYEPDWRREPVAFWVHRPVEGSDTFDPPAPPFVPHKGFAVLHVEFDAVDLRFSAPVQLDHCIDILSRKPLPTSRSLSSRLGLPVGPNLHWLSRLPAALKAPRHRMRLVESLREIRMIVSVPGDGAAFRIPATQ